MTSDRKLVRAGELFEVPTSWLDTLGRADRAALHELGYQRFRGPQQSLIQARQHRVGRFVIGGVTFVLEHPISLPLVLAMATYVDGGVIESFEESSLHGARVGREDDALSDLLALLLCREARNIAARQIYGCYELRSSKEQVLRGRVNWSRSFGGPSVAGMVCDYHDRSTDVLENQVVLAALKRVVSWRLESALARRMVAEQVHVWTGVCSQQSITALSFEQLAQRRNRMNGHYHTALAVSRLVLDGARGLQETLGGDDLQSLWLDVPGVFERFVSELLRRAAVELGATTEIQRTNRSALVDASGGPYRAIRPDLVLKRAGHVLAVVDMKAKPQYATGTSTGLPQERISTADIFQLLFYSAEAGKSNGGARVPAFIVAPSLEGGLCIAPRHLQVQWASPELGGTASLVLCPLSVKRVLGALRDGKPAHRVVAAELPALGAALLDTAADQTIAHAGTAAEG